MTLLLKKPRLFTCLLVGLLSTGLLGSAADLYVSQSGTGDGSSAGSAQSLAWLNANWTAINAGDTVHLVGTLNNTLTVGKSGNPGSPITVKFESGARMSAPFWNPAAIVTGSCSNVVVDGGVNGLIIATANGTGLAHTNTSRGVFVGEPSGPNNPSFVTVQNLTISNMYVRTPGCGEYSPQDLTGATTIGILVNGSHISILNNIVSGAEGGIALTCWNSGVTRRAINIFGNQLYRNCISLSLQGDGASPNSKMYDLNIVSNRFDHWSEWSAIAPGNGDVHLDGIYLFATAGAGIDSGTMIVSNVVISHNWFGPDVLAPGAAKNTTSTIFMTWYSTNTSLQVALDFKVFNNVFVWTNTSDVQTPWNNGNIRCNAWGNSIIANNTIISKAFQHGDGYTYGQGTAIQSADTGVKILNNFTLDFATQYIYDQNSGLTNFNPGFFIDYNCWGRPFTSYVPNNNDYFGPPAVPFGNAKGYSWADWTVTKFGGKLFDQHSRTKMPVIDAKTYQPLANDTVLVNAGTNLTSWGIVDDFYGNPRPATGPWTIGAFQTTSSQKIVLPPTINTVTPNKPAP